MEDKTKSSIMQSIAWAIDHKENLSGEFLIKKSSTIVKVELSFSEQEFFIDDKGQKWVRA